VAKPQPSVARQEKVVAEQEPFVVQQQLFVAKPKPFVARQEEVVAKPEPSSVEQPLFAAKQQCSSVGLLECNESGQFHCLFCLISLRLIRPTQLLGTEIALYIL
jgi:hypothetical protein